MTKKRIVMTLGTSNNTWNEFRGLLDQSGADVILDVRASPFSRHKHFCQRELRAKLNFHGWSYLHLPSLGGLAADDNRSYAEALRHPAAQAGLELIAHIATRAVPVIVCAEGQVLGCHRFLMISPGLIAMGMQVNHVSSDGRIETHAEAEARMMRKLRLPEQDLWKGKDELLAAAYAMQERRVRRLK